MKVKYILISLLLAGSAYAAVALTRQLNLLKQSCIKFVSYHFESLTVNYAKLWVTLQITNNSNIDLKLKTQKFDIYINDAFVSNVTTKPNITLLAQSAQNIDLAIEFNPKDILKVTFSALFNKSSDIKIQVKGSLTVISGLIVVSNIKIDESITLAEILSPDNQNSSCN